MTNFGFFERNKEAIQLVIQRRYDSYAFQARNSSVKTVLSKKVESDDSWRAGGTLRSGRLKTSMSLSATILMRFNVRDQERTELTDGIVRSAVR